MRFVEFNNIKEFADKTLDLIVNKEVENNLMVSNVVRGLEGADISKWFMCTIEDKNGSIAGVALMTPPYNLTLYIDDSFNREQVIDELINGILDKKIKIPGIVAEDENSRSFIEKYCNITGASCKKTLGLKLYKLDKVNNVSHSSGNIRLASEKDLYFLPHWHKAFAEDCNILKESIAEAYDKCTSLIENKLLYIWEDRFPVAQVSKGRKTLNGYIINAVYTPPYFRGKGYATTCVAELSRLILESGCKYSSLFADTSNPISNSIYQKVGYEYVGNLIEFKIEE